MVIGVCVCACCSWAFPRYQIGEDEEETEGLGDSGQGQVVGVHEEKADMSENEPVIHDFKISNFSLGDEEEGPHHHEQYQEAHEYDEEEEDDERRENPDVHGAQLISDGEMRDGQHMTVV